MSRRLLDADAFGNSEIPRSRIDSPAIENDTRVTVTAGGRSAGDG
jgi:hypothetical protein